MPDKADAEPRALEALCNLLCAELSEHADLKRGLTRQLLLKLLQRKLTRKNRDNAQLAQSCRRYLRLEWQH